VVTVDRAVGRQWRVQKGDRLHRMNANPAGKVQLTDMGANDLLDSKGA